MRSIVRRLATFSKALIVAGLPAIAHRVSAADDLLPPGFREVALRAIESTVGGVFVVEVQASWPVRRSRVFEHMFRVEEVVKPYRTHAGSDSGTYYVPLSVNELTVDRKPILHAGKRYANVTKLDFTPYGAVCLDDAFEISSDRKDGILKELRAMTEGRATYGSSVWLRYYLGFPLDVDGVRTSHSDGFLDPDAFGFTREELRKVLGAGMQVLLTEFRHLRKPFTPTNGPLFHVVEHLAGPSSAEKDIRMQFETYSQLVDRSEAMPWPYKVSNLVSFRLYVVVVDLRGEEKPRLKMFMPVIGENDRTVRAIRARLKELVESTPERRKL
jgi:hypothetical protein